MSFEPKKQPYRGKINAVTLGTGDKAVVIGGQNVLPFYTFDAPIEHAPKIGVEISDLASEWKSAGLSEFYAGCTTMVDYARKAETMEGADFLCLHFESADPNGVNRSVADCVADAKAVADAVSMPIVIMGCKNIEKDGELFSKIAEALRADRTRMFLPCRASAILLNSSPSFSMFLQPMTTIGMDTASATAFASATQSATERFAPLGSADSKCRHRKSAPSMVSAFLA